MVYVAVTIIPQPNFNNKKVKGCIWFSLSKNWDISIIIKKETYDFH